MAFPFSRLLTVSTAAALISLPLMAGAATISVTQTTDGFGGEGCSLRDAIQSVNIGSDFNDCVGTGAYGTNDTINLTAQSYVLSLEGPNNDDNSTGDLDILSSVSIIGAGSGQTTITASGFTTPGETDRVLHVADLDSGASGFTVNLEGLTIRDGNSTPSGDGGGILVNASDADLNLNDVIVTNNLSEDDGGGISFNAFDGRLTLINSRVVNNDAPESAGGIDIGRASTAVLIDSTVDGNNTAFAGGGIYINGVLISLNSTISRNTAIFTEKGEEGYGGGIYNSGNFALINTTISGNTAQVFGGGIYSPDLRARGGDLSNVLGFLFNVTVAQNTVVNGIGGGICYNCEPAPQGDQPFEFQIANTLIAENSAESAPDCGGLAFVSNGYNLIGDDSGCSGFTATGDRSNLADVGIGPLQNNGGPTETHALEEGSPAVDKGNDVEGCQAPVIDDLFNAVLTLAPLTEDQRGFTRPVAILNPEVPICDIGAYELQVEEPTPTPTPVPPPGPSLLEGSGISCSLNLAGSSAGGAGLAGFIGVAALFAAWRGFGSKRQ